MINIIFKTYHSQLATVVNVFANHYITTTVARILTSRNSNTVAGVVTSRNYVKIFLFSLGCLMPFAVTAQKGKPSGLPPLAISKGQLIYTPDSLGNRIPDFSYCGYMAGEQAIPDVPVKIIVPVTDGDATARIQSAINYVGKLPADKTGIRGAVLLQAGTYHVNGSLKINTSGVVLRGSGFGENGTVVIGEGKGRETLIILGGKKDITQSTPVSVTDDYVPVNANTLHVTSANTFKTGDHIIITRPCTEAWIKELGTDHFGGGITSLGWKPGQREIQWRRTIAAVNGTAIVLDAPLTTALDKKYGMATIAAYAWPGMISQAGIENLQLISAFDTNNPKDEDHRWMAITMENVRDVWVRQVSCRHFAGSAVAIYETAARVTVEDCLSLQPVSEIGGERRNSFFTEGQQVLFQRCYAEYGMHDFATGFCAAGPTAFVQCESHQPYSFSGGIDSWSAGVLFDDVRIDGNAISMMNRGQDGQGAGWNMANSVLWNCSAARIDCYKPPTASNWAFGSWSQFAGDGYWAESNNSLEPRSLYYAQLRERLSDKVQNREQLLLIETSATSSPTIEQAAELTQLAKEPATTLKEFIYDAPKRQPVNIQATGVKTINDIGIEGTDFIVKIVPARFQNGWLTRGTELLTGGRTGEPWWSGSARPYWLAKAKPAITRFVPGRTGHGLTDDLDALTDSMYASHTVVLEHNYGLWYDRRRDDHERVRRMDGDVWAPFYELPFARSGQGTAWDGLSKYDLTTYNYWYWNRLRQFADLARQKGLILIQHHYFQHNIIEAGAHYADFPWRPANNINNTGFPEPPPYAGDKRIFMAEQFYDTTHPVRRALHKAYIRKCLENFANNSNVIHFIGEEYTGPLHFVQFWLDEIAAWEKETGKHSLIGLSVTKDVQDAILADPVRSNVVDVIDIRYWHYEKNGELYAPKGGQNLAPRQHARLLKPKGSSPEQVYRAVHEYKIQFPDKAVMYSANGYDRNGWAILMAGGSLPELNIRDEQFLQAVATMNPVITKGSTEWMLHNPQTGYIVYDRNHDKIGINLPAGQYEVFWVNEQNGSVKATRQKLKGEKYVTLNKPGNGNWVLWLKKR